MLKILACIVMLIWSTSVFSQNLRTKLTTPAAWSNALGWLPNGVPISGERVVIPAGVTVSTNADLTFTSLYLDILGKLVLGNNRSLTLTSADSYINVQGTGSIEASQTSNNNSQIFINGLTQFVSNQTYASNGGGKGLVNGPALATGSGTGFAFGIVLPVNFSSIRLQQLNESARISWQTSRELSNHHFNVERSPDTRSWTVIGTVTPGTATSNRYDFIDDQLLHGMNYYRICAVDLQGSKIYSGIMSSHYQSTLNRIEISPNPARSVASVKLPSLIGSESSKAIYRLYSNAGILVEHGTIFPGNRELNVSRLHNGVYQMVLLSGTGHRYFSSLFVQH
jgi:hypothetical protein